VNIQEPMTRLAFYHTARLTDPECEPRHVATVIVNGVGPIVEYLDARGLDWLDNLTVIAIPEQARETCAVHRGDIEGAADALIAIYDHGNVWARRVEG